MKKTILPIVSLFATLACGSVWADGTEGDIWQILPCDRYGQTVDRSGVTSDETVPAGSNIYFKVRLVSKGNDWARYHLATTNIYINPPRICVYASGVAKFADYVGEIEPSEGTHYTDVVFCYTPKAGDFAMPLLLGTASGPASDKYLNQPEYFFDPLTSWQWKWTSKKNDGSETATANWLFFNGDPASRDETGRTTGMDTSLAECHYYIKTVDFDDEWEDAGNIWRTVHEGSTTIKVGGEPSIGAASTVEETQTFYVWSDNEDAVKVSGPNLMKEVTVKTGMKRDVAVVQVQGYPAYTDFEITGVKEGGTANLVLSAYPKYNISDASGEEIIDYVTVPVRCAEKLPPTIKITPDSTKVIASSNYTYYVTELNVRFTQAYSQDVTFTLTPSLEVDPSLNWKDYIAIHDEKTLDIAVAAATNATFTIPKGETQPYENGARKHIYLFALRGDGNTQNTHHLQFTATTENMQAHTDITGWDTPTGLMNITPADPVITEPVEGDDTLTAVAGADRTLRIKVADTYADQNVVSNGYQIFIIKNSDTETAYVAVGGDDARYVPGQGGYLYLTNAAGTASDKLPTVQYSVTDPAVNKSVIKVQSPISGLQSDERHFNVTVSAPAGYTVNVIDDAGEVVKVPKYNEGEGGTIQIELDRQNDTGASLYAFLKPANDDAATAIQCGFLAANDNYGLEIQKFSTTAADSFVMIDGRGASNSSFKYTVELRTAPLYQDGVEVTSYQCKNTLVITSLNVIPEIEKIYLGLDETQLEGGKWVFPDLKIAKGVTQTFTAGVVEPGLTDLAATGTEAFKTRWRFSTTGVSTKGPDNADDKTNGVIYGDPETHKAEFTFTKAGTWKVIVDCQDKDMSTYGSGTLKGTFTFYVEVVDQPAITVTAHYIMGTGLSDEVTSFDETDSADAEGNAAIKVELGFNKCDFNLQVQLTVTDPGETNPGQFVLQESTNVKNMGSGIYYVTFSPGETSVTIPVKSLDGTRLSRSTGFQLTTKMLTHEPCPETGDPAQWTDEYYVGSSKYVKVANVQPEVDPLNIYPVPMTTNNTSVGTLNTISYDFTDVAGDFNETLKSVKVSISGAASDTQYVTDPSQTAGSFSFKLTDSGLNTVRLSFQDKDGQPVSFILYFLVEPSKTLKINPHGPPTSLSGLYQNNYGAGRVYATGEYSITDFYHTYNCGLAKTWRVYGYGYKVGDIDGKVFHYPATTLEPSKTDYYATRNRPIDATGKGADEGGYAYNAPTVSFTDKNGYPADSFLYAWVQKNTETTVSASTASSTTLKSGTTWDVLAYKPEAPYTTDAGTDVTLPTEALDDGTYDDTTLEAVFSLEYLWTDNMGDINMDGIPDAWFHNLSFTESTESTSDSTDSSDSDSDESTIADTVSVAAYNNDEDFLPELTLSGQGYLLDYTANVKFTALKELRGYGEGLNDAPNNNIYTRLTGFKPDRCYRDPDVYGPTSTLSKVEFLAWQEYAAANSYDPEDPTSWEKWSPENPTDPTKADTDDDGFDDGFEYAFWYRAHVGFYDEDTGMHTYLTGRRFDPKNPGEGTVITRQQIETLMNPTVAADESSVTRDTDNDGLPDALEFTLGTNPFEFDSDGDGLTDGYEVLVAATDPLLATTLEGTKDGARNLDGDAMAFTYTCRVGPGKMDMDNTCDEYVLATTENRPVDTVGYFTTFAIEDASGDSDGVQWYAVPETTAVETEVDTNAVGKVLLFTYYKGKGAVSDPANWIEAATTRAAIPVVAQADLPGAKDLSRLAGDLTKAETYLYETNETGDVILSEGVRVPAGSVIRYDASQTAADYFVRTLVADLEEKAANAAWLYGNETVTVAGYDKPQQLLALGRPLAAKKGARLVAAPKASRPVALVHHYVYQQYGFDPRTAWYAKTPLAKRWGTTVTSDGETEIVEGSKSSLAGMATRTRDFSTLDEQLLLSHLLNSGSITDSQVTMSANNPWQTIWMTLTTNPRGVGEGTVTSTETTTDDMGRERTTTTTETVDVNGADTDNDGVPDGWELYVMGAGKQDGKFTTVDIEKDAMSPLVAKSSLVADTDSSPHGDGDKLTEWQEYAGTDSVNAYTNVSTTITRPSEHAQWLNKFFPTDPWNADTDGDGLSDASEIKSGEVFKAGAFIYGTPEDDDNRKCIPGGGLNPCSVDTDRDGLPDAWEAQFAGSTPYSGEFTEKTATGNTKSGNSSWGLIDGMDGTVPDAYTQPNHKETSATAEAGDGLSNTVYRIVSPCRDYDHDGLENWQEYMVGAMRCWRYDDPYSRWDALSGNSYTNENGVLDIEKACAAFGFADETDFWYRTLADKTSPYYNPHFVFDTVPGAIYWSRVTNAWDIAYKSSDGGAYYQFFHRAGATHLKDLWGKGMKLDETPYNQFPQKYVACSPIEADTDQDGMDDYYELFHGLNPLLGQSGVRKVDKGPYDVIYDAWYLDAVGSPFTAENNWWTSGEHQTIKPADSLMDFVAHPWLNGSATADPDGDDVRNQEEAIMPKVATATWHHTDPTPVWMTDSSFSNSLVRLFGRMPTQPSMMTAPEGSFTVQPDPESDPITYYFRDFDGYACVDTIMGPMRYYMAYLPDHWYVANHGKPNWLFSFEENEGYDSDHDGISDHEELEGKFRTASDPIDVDSPRRRQAMYFQGPSRPSLLMTMPRVAEKSPDMENEYPDDLAFLQYTVECWAYPESNADATLVERAVWAAPSSTGDQEYLRCNFQLAVKNGKWYTKFDPRGTLRGNQVEAYSLQEIDVAGWTHLAATYDGKTLTLYVNGQAEAAIISGLQPEYGVSAVAFKANRSYAFDREYSLLAILVGASAKTQADGRTDGTHLNVLANEQGLDAYKNWFKGYIDEVRIWDGARSGDEIATAMKTRMTSELAIENRSEFYDQWSTVDGTYPNGRRRYAKDSSGKDCEVMPELRYHYAFDSIFAAENEAALAKEPHGFSENGVKAPVSRPDGYVITWWSDVLAHYANTVYDSALWVTWVPNTVAHLPRFDGTTLDSYYWSEDFMGDVQSTYKFARTAEPVSLWTQRTSERVYLSSSTVNGSLYLSADLAYRTAGTRHHLVNSMGDSTQFHTIFDFTGRHLNQSGDDLLPLGGAYVKYCDETVGLWDNQGASTTWEITGNDADNDGLPDWWETYADENYRLGDEPFESIGWNTIVNYHGNEMTAGAAYLRDLAKGFYANSYGEIVEGPTKFRQTYDENANGIPDWWEDVYRLTEQNPLADSDNDGLPNYLEYMLSEIFDFGGKLFDPTVAKSVDKHLPDYFFRLGSLYVGEVFTDHDLVDDLWEDQYADDFTSRLKYDAFQDQDEDGWCNRSENRYSKACMPIVANNQTHFTAADGLVADYPIPTIALTLRYNGARQDAVRVAPIIVEMTTDGRDIRDPDATYSIGEISTEKTDSTSDKEATTDTVSYTKTLGKWSKRRAIGTLTPGNIDQGNLMLEYCADPSLITYRWYIDNYYYDSGSSSGYHQGGVSYVIFSGTSADYWNAQRKYGAASVHLIDRTLAYAALDNLTANVSETGEELTWVCNVNGKTLGTVNLSTGAYDLDLSVFEGVTVSSTNGASGVSLEDQTFRFSYTANPSVGLPRKLYLGDATTGHVREGKNTIVAFADLDNDQSWDPGEPYGIVRNVDVSWRGTSAEIELTDVSPVLPRVDLVTDTADRTTTRTELHEKMVNEIYAQYGDQPLVVSNLLKRIAWWDNNVIVDATLPASQSEPVRVRVVRWLVNDIPVYEAGSSMRVVYDKMIESDVKTALTEADFLSDAALDLDWEYLRSEIIDNASVQEACGTQVTTVTYLIVIGDGPAEWHTTATAANYEVSALQTLIRRHYSATRVMPVAVSPGNDNQVVVEGSPTFRWTVDSDDREGYTAFKVQVKNASGDTVYDSAIQPMPSRLRANDGTLSYEWQAPLYVGDKTPLGKVFANNADYTWSVSVYNSKYTGDAFSTSRDFHMNVQTNGYATGKANVAVKYFGPKKVWSRGETVRVRAFTSPDFTGRPAAAGYVVDPSDAETGLNVTGQTIRANCTVYGLPKGTYYLQAFVDSNGNGVCDTWESQGYFCQRDGSTADFLNPVAVTIGTTVGDGDLATIYLEDADTDMDGLPDAWEYAMYGNLTTRGIELLTTTPAGETVVNMDLTGTLTASGDMAGGLAAKALTSLQNAGTLALALGADVSETETFNDAITGLLSEELVEEGVKIERLEMVDGKIVIAVSAATGVTTLRATAFSSVLATEGRTFAVTCDVYRTATLDNPEWKLVKSETITAGAAEASEISLDATAAEGGFYKVEVHK